MVGDGRGQGDVVGGAAEVGEGRHDDPVVDLDTRKMWSGWKSLVLEEILGGWMGDWPERLDW